MLLEDLVNNNLSKLNPTDLIVWRYIYAHKKECCYISIYDIADACNVSRTTVLRFAKKLGLDGFSDLKMMLKMQISQAWEQPSMDIAQATTDLCQKVGEEVAKQDFTRINKLLYHAKRIFIYSSGHVQKTWAMNCCVCLSTAMCSYMKSKVLMNLKRFCIMQRKMTCLLLYRSQASRKMWWNSGSSCMHREYRLFLLRI